MFHGFYGPTFSHVFAGLFIGWCGDLLYSTTIYFRYVDFVDNLFERSAIMLFKYIWCPGIVHIRGKLEQSRGK
jgi:hypothetical protein